MSDTELLALLQPIVDRVRTDVSAVKVIGGDMYRSDDALTRARLVGHISGPKIRGAYLIKPGESVCRAAVLDLDDHNKAWSWEDIASVASRLIKAGSKLGLKANAWSSSSGHGIHLWYLWDEPQDAYSVRNALSDLLTACMLKSGAGGLDKGEVEVFPKQSEVGVGAYGNQVWLPLGGVSRPLEPDFINGTLRPAPLEWVVGVCEAQGWDWKVSGDVPVVERPAQVVRVLGGVSDLAIERDEQLGEIQTMLEHITDYSYDHWLKVGFALNEATGGGSEGLSLWDEWSARGAEYVAGACASKWGSMAKRGADAPAIGLGSLRKWARDGGWTGVSDRDFQDLSVPVVGGVDKDPLTEGPAKPNYEREKSGRPLATTDNIMLALAAPTETGLILGFDEFKDELMFAKAGCAGQWQHFKDVHYNRIKCALENRGRGFKPVSRQDLRECIADQAARNAFDSAKLWLSGLQWDGVPRVSGFLEGYLGAASGAYSVAVSEYIWTALAGRVLSPGCQADMMPILVGEEGTGKSSAIRALVPGPQYACEVSFDEEDDDLARKMRGVLVAEVSELRGLGTRDEESIYAFVVRRYEKWIPKFKEFSSDFPRRVILFGTANDEEFLSKPGRRWLPFNVGLRAGRREEDLRVDLIERDREQLWAEGAARWKAGGVAWQEAERLGKAESNAFIAGHPWEDSIRRWLSDYSEVIGEKLPDGRVFLPSHAILSQAIDIKGRMTSADGRVLARCMKRLGYERAEKGLHNVRGWAKAV